MPPANIESDPLFVLLTDALRAGPGSSQWQQAVDALRERGDEGTDEHRLLLQARESLEAGREYRSVRAGAGFTRKVMADIESGPPAGGRRDGPPIATIVAIVCGLLILSAVAYVGWRMSPHEVNAAAQIDELELKSQGFVDKIATATFAGPIPDGWHTIGSLKLDSAEGIKPDAQALAESKNLGGGVVLSRGIASAQSFALEITPIAQQPATGLLLEAFVTTDNTFSSEKATSSHDLVWQLERKSQVVLVNGSVKSAGDAPVDYHPGDSIRLLVGPEVAIVEAVPAGGGKPVRIWSGPHELGTGQRFAGVRFLQTGPSPANDLRVATAKVTTTAGGN